MKRIILIVIITSFCINCFPQVDNYNLPTKSLTNDELRSTYFSTNLEIYSPSSFIKNDRANLGLTNTNLCNDLSFKGINNSFNNFNPNNPNNDAASIGKRFVIGAAGGALIGWFCGMLATHGGQDSTVGPWAIAGGVVGGIGVALFFSF